MKKIIWNFLKSVAYKSKRHTQKVPQRTEYQMKKAKLKIKKCLSKEFTKTGKTEINDYTVLGGTPFSGSRTYSYKQTDYEVECDKCKTIQWKYGTGNKICLQPLT